jgi:hypothetical protein
MSLPIIIGVVALLLIVISILFMKRMVLVLINSLLGFFALFGWNALFPWDITINVWSVLLVAIFGIIGLIIVIALHFFGVAF